MNIFLKRNRAEMSREVEKLTDEPSFVALNSYLLHFSQHPVGGSIT